MHVIGENFVRKSSGFFVPSLIGMVANPLGQFQPCGSCCADEPCARNCQPGTAPLLFEVTLSYFIQVGICVGGGDCLELNNTFVLNQTGPESCYWEYHFGGGLYNCGLRFLQISVEVADYLILSLHNMTGYIQWSVELPLDGEGLKDCGYTGWVSYDWRIGTWDKCGTLLLPPAYVTAV